MHRFQLALYEPYFRYSQKGILYTAKATIFTLEQVEKAFDEGKFVPSIDYITHRPNFTQNNEPVYYLPHDALDEGLEVQMIEIDNQTFSDRVIQDQDLRNICGREYINCIFYDCILISKNHIFQNCRFIRCSINGINVNDLTNLAELENSNNP